MVNLAVADLFDTPILPGLATSENFISAAEERALIALIGDCELTPFQFQQWTGKRLTCSFGWKYDFGTGCFAPAEPIPDWLLPLKAKAAGFAGLDPTDLVQALLIRYDPGAGIGWHRDRPVFEHVVGVSLGQTARMRFRRRSGTKFERAYVPLQPRSIYHLSGESRNEWEHSIACVDAVRWSITFRSLTRAKGLPLSDLTS
ncbi:alpha-ketoglutarate-dependent dioxygenase AlkB [Sphingobium amiense]|uniref:Alpha-ketoglutarate-dependent dioxygenase AlkB n=1 Tax=Sphingobium amiense TaxID=135719 RepID=A0A494W937_9SPHN|nr:alpha-ketoglutarate-dependent dioxygenase AlkB [Sphingobium amiense]BBD96955.1 alpha-ketoglutarate-dependent dioxygenase AlkB [Sphingobium amiense]